MLFRDLYKIVEQEFTEAPVSFDFLRSTVNKGHAGVGEIKIWAITYPVPNHQAHYVLLYTDRTSGYDDEFDVAEIRYCDALDGDPFERRYALTKELMHVFDTDAEKTDTREKFIKLLKEIQNQPLAAHASAMFNSELDTRWMAAIILCPKYLRDKYYPDYWANKIEDFELSEIFQIPEWVIGFIMDDYYDEAFELLMKKGVA
ncbi:MAG: hypothetical protein KIT02_15385 [Devosia sp.]|uniref:hypothetical protein n=1 Tax=Devosia sp. TaxID=1871048 RepID=UPI0024CBE0D5|nr:hypothetical protein [Devosia sp.]UYN99281.1 MAG: hypothetical protein KIT02_15385 [Devosia sp.]